MDTSEIYIKMSDHPKIQGEWKLPPLAHDFCYRVRDGLIKPGQNLLAMEFDAEEWLWLPRQDQIQEILHAALRKSFTNATIFLVNNFFYHWLYNGGHMRIKTKTLEQLWLAFYMYEKHMLVWNGKKWQKE